MSESTRRDPDTGLHRVVTAARPGSIFATNMELNTVTGHHWDLVNTRWPKLAPSVGVVIPYYNDQRGLNRVIAAIRAQRYPSGLIKIVVADDGSAHSPQVPADVIVVRQDDQGFRAAAARNLGAAQCADREVLCFLDGDTAPDPDYLRWATRLPAILPEALVVGRRLHFVDGKVQEPQWLSSAYQESSRLLFADDRSYRFVISAVLTCSRAFFQHLGGFDSSIVGYGGEDWELGHRAWQSGAILCHEPRASAWHEGEDFGGRALTDPALARRIKNAETTALTQRITVPQARPPGVQMALPDLVVWVATGSDDAVATIGSILGTTDAHIGCTGSLTAVPEAFSRDDRCKLAQHLSPTALRSARAHIWLKPGVLLAHGALARATTASNSKDWVSTALHIDGHRVGRLVTRRGRSRCSRWEEKAVCGTGYLEIEGSVAPEVQLEGLYSGQTSLDSANASSS